MNRAALGLCLILAGCGGMNPFARETAEQPRGISLQTDAGGLEIQPHATGVAAQEDPAVRVGLEHLYLGPSPALRHASSCV